MCLLLLLNPSTLTLVRKLNRIAPLEGLRHVKRVCKACLDGGKGQLFVILCLASGKDGDETDMPEDVLELVHTYDLSTFTTKVCRYAASTKEEWEEQCRLWPTFHPPAYSINGITGFNLGDSLSGFNYMKLAFGLAKSSISVVNSAVIVDPSNRQIIASSCDQVLSSNALTSGTSQYDANKMEDESMLPLRSSSLEVTQSYRNVSSLRPWGGLSNN